MCLAPIKHRVFQNELSCKICFFFTVQRDVKRPSTPPEPYPASDEDRSRGPVDQSPPSMSTVLANAYRGRHRPPSPIDSPPQAPPTKGPRTPPSPKALPPSPPPQTSLSPRSKRHRSPPMDYDIPSKRRRSSRDRNSRETSRDRRRTLDSRDRYDDKRARTPPRYKIIFLYSEDPKTGQVWF